MHSVIIQGVVNMVNRETGLHLRLVGATDGGAISCRSTNGQPHAIVCYGGMLNPIVRSVIRARRSKRRFSWLCNGQAATNATEVVRWDEDHRYHATAEEVAEVLEAEYPGTWPKHVATGSIRLPNHLSPESVLNAKALPA